jgi:hypothetical protein
MASDLLDRMRLSPASDWSIADVERLCRAFGLRCTAPSGGGSHYNISHPSQRDILTVPFRPPIKPAYMRKLVRFIDAVKETDAQS